MKNRSLIESFNNAINGIISALKTERNMKIHLAAAVLVLILSLFYDLSRIEFIIVCFTIALVIICELFNTAIEVIIDTIIGIYHPKAKVVKDTAAGCFHFSTAFCCSGILHIFRQSQYKSGIRYFQDKADSDAYNGNSDCINDGCRTDSETRIQKRNTVQRRHAQRSFSHSFFCSYSCCTLF